MSDKPNLLEFNSLKLLAQLENLPQESVELAFRLLWSPESQKQEWQGRSLPPELESLPPEGWAVLASLLESILESQGQHRLH